MSRVSTATSKPKVAGTAAQTGQTSSKKKSVHASQVPADAERYQMIATAAYYRAEQRGFMGGDPMEDWLAAEAEISRLYH